MYKANSQPLFTATKLTYREKVSLPLVRSLLWAIGVITLALIIIPWVQTAEGIGRVITFDPNNREQSLDAPISGRVTKWYVYEGSRVNKDDPIVQLSDIDSGFLERLQAEREAVLRRFDAARSASQTSKRNLERQKKLVSEGLSSQRDYEQANLEYMNLSAREAEAAAELARIDVRLARQENQLIRAPRAGTVARILVSEGSQYISAGEKLATIVPDATDIAVELWVDGLNVPLITEGRKVRLQFEGWPVVQFAGWPSVAIGTFGGTVVNIDPVGNHLGHFRILIRPDRESDEAWPEPRFLRQGARARGWIQLETVALGYELWRLFNNFPPALREGTSSLLGPKPSEKKTDKSKVPGLDGAEAKGE